MHTRVIGARAEGLSSYTTRCDTIGIPRGVQAVLFLIAPQIGARRSRSLGGER